MDDEARRVPFRNMIYVGDGKSDVPCMSVTNKNGGYAVAVYPPGRKAPKGCLRLLQASRVHAIAPADFTPESPLVQILKTTLKTIAQNIALQHSIFSQKNRYS